MSDHKIRKAAYRVTRSRLEIYKGLIPGPQMLDQYKAIDPNLPRRIVQWTEDEGHHRRGVETRVLRNAHSITILGSVLGFLSVVTISCLCYFFMVHGHAQEGMWIACTIIVALAIVFVLRKVPPLDQPKDRE